MNYDIDKMFNNLLSPKTIDEIKSNYDKYKDLKLVQLGIDSLLIMEIFMRIEDFINKPINLESFDVGQIDGLEKINKYIEENI